MIKLRSLKLTEKITEDRTEKDFSIWLDNKITLETHEKKFQSQLNDFNCEKNIPKLTNDIFLKIYQVLIRPHLQFASIVWYP